jgi:hypothetical protein
MPLQNRVTPFGEIVALPERGTLMGNRGGRIHEAGKRLGSRRFASRRWISCELVYGNWHREVMGEGYTELFFLDEVTALAAGHRPCFFCRRRDADRFASAFAEGQGLARTDAEAMDRLLHAERLDGRRQRRHSLAAEALPDGAMMGIGREAFAVKAGRLLRWSPGQWTRAGAAPTGTVDTLTPPGILAALRAGYRPRWHPSAGIA